MWNLLCTSVCIYVCLCESTGNEWDTTWVLNCILYTGWYYKNKKKKDDYLLLKMAKKKKKK